MYILLTDKVHAYFTSLTTSQVILENKGDIDAGYKLLQSRSLFGPFFTFSPSSGVLQPGALQAIQVNTHTQLSQMWQGFF